MRLFNTFYFIFSYITQILLLSDFQAWCTSCRSTPGRPTPLPWCTAPPPLPWPPCRYYCCPSPPRWTESLLGWEHHISWNSRKTVTSLVTLPNQKLSKSTALPAGFPNGIFYTSSHTVDLSPWALEVSSVHGFVPGAGFILTLRKFRFKSCLILIGL